VEFRNCGGVRWRCRDTVRWLVYAGSVLVKMYTIISCDVVLDFTVHYFKVRVRTSVDTSLKR
jgi:hypothetical protein